MEPGKVSIFGFVTGFLLLCMAGILVLTGDSPDVLKVQENAVAFRGTARKLLEGTTGLSGTPSDSGDSSSSGSGDSGSGDSSSSESSDNSLFGGNHNYTMAPFGVVGGEYIVYLVGGLIAGVYAFFYKIKVVDTISPLYSQQPEGKDDFEFGICDCLFDVNMCCHLIFPCCVFVRQAHTNHVTKVAPFWTTFWLYYLTGLCCGIGPCCLTVYYRMKLKEHMGIEDHVINDLCLAWFCAPCAVGQQAMAVDDKLGYEVEMCCELRWNKETETVYER